MPATINNERDSEDPLFEELNLHQIRALEPGVKPSSLRNLELNIHSTRSIYAALIMNDQFFFLGNQMQSFDLTLRQQSALSFFIGNDNETLVELTNSLRDCHVVQVRFSGARFLSLRPGYRRRGGGIIADKARLARERCRNFLVTLAAAPGRDIRFLRHEELLADGGGGDDKHPLALDIEDGLVTVHYDDRFPVRDLYEGSIR